MSQLTNYLENKIAAFHKNTAFGTAPTVRLGLWQGSPGEAGTGGVEGSATISARQPITLGAIATNGIYREVKNSALVDFGTSAAATTIDAFAVMDALTGGNALLYGTFASKSINIADPVTVPINNLVVGISGTATTYLRDIVLNWLKGTAAPTSPANLYVSVWNGNPLSGGTDITTTISTGRKIYSLGTVTNGAGSNSAVIDFGNALAGAIATHIAIYDALTGGNMWHAAALDAAKTINLGDSVTFPNGTLTISIA